MGTSIFVILTWYGTGLTRAMAELGQNIQGCQIRFFQIHYI